MYFKILYSNHRLPIGTGSLSKFPQYEMLCELCNEHRIADEYPYKNVLKIQEIISSRNVETLKHL